MGRIPRAYIPYTENEVRVSLLVFMVEFLKIHGGNEMRLRAELEEAIEASKIVLNHQRKEKRRVCNTCVRPPEGAER